MSTNTDYRAVPLVAPAPNRLPPSPASSQDDHGSTPSPEVFELQGILASRSTSPSPFDEDERLAFVSEMREGRGSSPLEKKFELELASPRPQYASLAMRRSSRSIDLSSIVESDETPKDDVSSLSRTPPQVRPRPSSGRKVPLSGSRMQEAPALLERASGDDVPEISERVLRFASTRMNPILEEDDDSDEQVPMITIEELKKIVRNPRMQVDFPANVTPNLAPLMRKLQAFQMRFLDEYAGPRAFFERIGAFGYHEVFDSCLNVIQGFQFNISSPALEESIGLTTSSIGQCYRAKKLPAEMRNFFEENLQFLTNELHEVSEKLGPQIGVFRELLVEFAQLELETEPGRPMDPEKVRSIRKRLRHIELELIRSVRIFQERKLAFQPLAILCREFELGEFKGKTLRHIGGREMVLIPPNVEPTSAMIKEYQLAANMYRAYVDSIIDSHFYYCSKFLTAIGRLKECLPPVNPGQSSSLIRV